MDADDLRKVKSAKRLLLLVFLVIVILGGALALTLALTFSLSFALAFALTALAATLATEGAGTVGAGEFGGHVAGTIGVLGVGDELELNNFVGGEGLEAIVALGGLDDVLVDDDDVLGVRVGGDELVDYF